MHLRRCRPFSTFIACRQFSRSDGVTAFSTGRSRRISSGGATGSIGDPSGRSTERTALEADVLQRNVKGITDQVHGFFTRGDEYIRRRKSDVESADGTVTVVNNHDWLKGISFLDFLRDVGKLAKVNTMIARDSVKSRLNNDNGISFTEFSYQLLQAYDFAHLHKNHNCRIQLGGSDQWGNIVAGIDLIKRQQTQLNPAPAYGLTFPLLTTENGEKFGKSAGNAVWLDGVQTSVHDFYQFFYRLPDVSVEQQLKLFTLLPLPRIQEIMEEHSSAKEKRIAQKILAEEVTELVHGYDALQQSLTSAQLLFKVPLDQLKSKTALEQLSHEPFFHRVKWEEIDSMPLTKVLTSYELVKSGKEASRVIASRGVSVSGRVVEDPREILRKEDIRDEHLIVIKSGKKGHLVFYVE